jgi:hypothetical protein
MIRLLNIRKDHSVPRPETEPNSEFFKNFVKTDGNMSLIVTKPHGIIRIFTLDILVES